MEESSTTTLRYTKRWFAYFDLLGFANLVRTHEIDHVLPLYEEVLATITQKAESSRNKGISYSWFSDTFILFTRGSTEKEFALIEHVSRLFFQKLILSEIPVRGALTIGPLYTQQKKNIFLGEALIDAYEYGEKQDWLGFLLTPNAYQHLDGTSLQLERRAHYRPVDIEGVIKHPQSSNVFAFAFNNGWINGKNPYLKAVQSMKRKSGKAFEKKYLNTEKFINRHGRFRPNKAN